jgi:hypothetical protein
VVLAGPVAFGSTTGAADEDELDDLLAELAEDTCFLPLS